MLGTMRRFGAFNPHLIGLAAMLIASGVAAWFWFDEPAPSTVLGHAANHIDYAHDMIVNEPMTSEDRTREIKVLTQYSDYMEKFAADVGDACLAETALILKGQADELLEMAGPREAAGPISLDLVGKDISSAKAKKKLASCGY